jgi:type II secretory pathway pseudopilin PulG
MSERQKGYTLLILIFAVSILSIGLLVAVPVWQTQIQREKEEELIFRGNQYVEAVRLFQLKKPGSFPSTLDELIEEKCLRRLYRDPMTSHGEWNIILPISGVPRRSHNRLAAPARILSSALLKDVEGGHPRKAHLGPDKQEEGVRKPFKKSTSFPSALSTLWTIPKSSEL